jgi:hypothetical protein
MIVPSYSAFPSDCMEQSPGLSKREYLAALALQGLLANYPPHCEGSVSLEVLARLSVQAADTLIDQLNRKA